MFSNERIEGAAQAHLLQVETPRAFGDAGVSDTEAVGWPLSLAPAPGSYSRGHSLALMPRFAPLLNQVNIRETSLTSADVANPPPITPGPAP